MQTLFYWIVLGGVKILQLLPLRWVARLGRCGGGLAYFLDARHRKVARANLSAAFSGEKSVREIHDLAREHFRRLGENYASAIKMASMSSKGLLDHLSVAGVEKIARTDGRSLSRVVAVGHFGNFELYARIGPGLEAFQFATTYRGLNHPKLDRLLAALRSKSGCLFFERRTDSARLRQAMEHKSIILGLLSDQHAGESGAWIPFLGRVCSTNTSAALLAQRYKLPLFTAICYRTDLAQWRIEFGDEIPTLDANSSRRSVADIMSDVNRVFEQAIRRDPPNWFWVHDRWKPRKRRSSRSKKKRLTEDFIPET